MKELLTGSSQVILTDIKLLETEIDRVLSKSKYFGKIKYIREPQISKCSRIRKL